ncbi:hypothetical protein BDN72DRAFT_552384 [Pluteus cervinus]|uniref:Uncharacterized protein n=1 Tax=Pluteus cervinus TaxID=181527 RepID=A0ACD3AWY7_9AGAR|nr:hypothetical protein BDN72DRAFT_552384 [Pluteus cervinus]
MDQALFTTPTFGAPTSALHHILTGSFRSLSLALLAFSPLNKTLQLVQSVDVPEDAPGPYQYIALNPGRNRAYTTTWAWPPKLISWEIDRGGGNDEEWGVSFLNSVPITATSSYTVIPHPYTHIYSMGGPTGEVHEISPAGAFGSKIQEVLFVPGDQLESADKTRVALRYGSHGVEFSSALSRAFVPVLGTDTIEMYSHNPQTGKLVHIFTSRSPRGADAHDGPRHVKIHPNGRILYSVTEHSNYVDIYEITEASVIYLASVSLIPEELRSNSGSFRGDTLLLAPSSEKHPAPIALFATTRGDNENINGWVSAIKLDKEGKLSLSADSLPSIQHYEMPTSGGKAHAIDLLSKTHETGPSDGLWIVLTDDSDAASLAERGRGGGVRILEWNGWNGTEGLKTVASWPGAPGSSNQESQWYSGGSHAVWLD